jgi:DNA-binding NarL/FixJ family response regulator
MNNTEFSDPTEQSEITLIDDKHWVQIGKRFNMTRRELEVAGLVCRGMDNRHIAIALNIREGTVKTHIRSIYRRLNVQNRIAMFLKFIRFAVQPVENESRSAVLPVIIEYAQQARTPQHSEVVK